MTENEAIKVMKWYSEEEYGEGLVSESHRMAIQALEEIQQYRAMEQRLQKVYGECDGLLETVVHHLENYENIELPDNIIKARLLTDEDVDKWEQLKAIGTIEEFKALKEKNVAKKPHSISIANDIGNSMVECPICHARSDYDVKSIKRGHCWKCGQKLDWSE